MQMNNNQQGKKQKEESKKGNLSKIHSGFNAERLA